jgi:lipid-binding SYLF domain-containing protein
MPLLSKLRRAASKVVSGVKKELDVLDTVNPEVQAALKRAEKRDPGLKPFLKKARGYAVFPAVGKAAAVVGAAFGKGEVFEQGKLVSYAGIVQATIGVQLGGGTFTEIIAFENKPTLERFRRGLFTLSANASAVMVKAGAAASADYEKGAAVFVLAQGGMMLEASIGGQKFIVKPAVLGRGTPARHAKTSGGTPGGSNQGEGHTSARPSSPKSGGGKSGRARKRPAPLKSRN